MDSEFRTRQRTPHEPAKKPAKVETGVEVLVPLFVKQGETIIVDTESVEYVSRA